MSQATSITSVAQQLALAMGVAIAALALDAARYARGDFDLIAADFAPAFVAVGLIAMTCTLLFVGLPKDAGAALTARAKIADAAREPDPQG